MFSFSETVSLQRSPDSQDHFLWYGFPFLLYFFGVFFCSVFVQPDAEGANLIFVSTMHLPDQNINPGVIGRHLLESETYCIYNHVLITAWCLFLIELELEFVFYFIFFSCWRHSSQSPSQGLEAICSGSHKREQLTRLHVTQALQLEAHERLQLLLIQFGGPLLAPREAVRVRRKSRHQQNV